MQKRLAAGIEWRGVSASRPFTIQNGKLVGSLTDVCVNEPVRVCVIPIERKYYSDTIAVVSTNGDI